MLPVASARRGITGRDIYTNCPGWSGDYRGPYVLVDGFQRLTAVLRFLHNEIKVFGHNYSEFTGSLPFGVDFIWHVAELDQQSDVLRWYINFNAGGTPHSAEEIARVRKMLEQVEKEEKR